MIPGCSGAQAAKTASVLYHRVLHTSALSCSSGQMSPGSKAMEYYYHVCSYLSQFLQCSMRVSALSYGHTLGVGIVSSLPCGREPSVLGAVVAGTGSLHVRKRQKADEGRGGKKKKERYFPRAFGGTI